VAKIKIGYVIIALLFLVGIPLLLIFGLGIPWEMVVLMGFVTMLFVGLLLFALFMLGRKKIPDLAKNNFAKVDEATQISCPASLWKKPVYTDVGAFLGNITGFATVAEVIDDSKKGSGEKYEEQTYVFRIERPSSFVQKLLPFLKKNLLVRVKPEVVKDLSTPDVILLCDTVKRLDNYFYTPVIANVQERRQLIGIENEVYREHSVFVLDKLGETTDKAMKSSPQYLQKKDEREGGLGTTIKKAIKGEE